MPPKPGELYWAYSEEPDRHPVIVVSREELNRGDYVVAVVLTSCNLEVRRNLPNCVPLRAGQFGLTKDCVAQAETITVFAKSALDLENGPFALLDDETFRSLVHAIGYTILSECEPV